jgi:hypothetical protein
MLKFLKKMFSFPKKKILKENFKNFWWNIFGNTSVVEMESSKNYLIIRPAH